MNASSFSARKVTNIGIGFLFVLLAALALSSCASKARAEEPSCSADMNMRVTINVTDVKPQVVFDRLARDPDCAITVSPFVWKHVTLQVEDATVLAPRAGLVTSRLVEPGEILAPGAVLVVVTDLADAWLTAYLGERDLGRIRLGQEAQVVTDDGQSRTGKVTFIASQAEFTPKNVQTAEEREKLVYRVKIALPNGDGLFKPGMPATARLAAAPGNAK